MILESVRADATCIAYEPDCRRTEATNRLFPERVGFPQMRSMDSTTAVSLAVLWSGLSPADSRDNLHTWPLIFDYAHAAGFDTAFWTSQNMLFGNARLWVKNLGVSKFFSATDLDPTADLDMGAPEGLLADRVIAEFGTLREPFMAVVQLSNVHYPYYLDASGPQPFQPSTTSKAPEDNPYFKNFYQNAVYQQDQHLAKMLGYVRSTEAGKRTVIVYTSDHAEAFREHDQMGHTFSLFDEEIHVPGWIDAPPGTLTAEEAQALAQKIARVRVPRGPRAHDFGSDGRGPRPQHRSLSSAHARPQPAPPRAQRSTAVDEQLHGGLELRVRELGHHAKKPQSRIARLGHRLEVPRRCQGSARASEPPAQRMRQPGAARPGGLWALAGAGDPQEVTALRIRRVVSPVSRRGARSAKFVHLLQANGAVLVSRSNRAATSCGR